jgi:hypothetical protein
MQRYANPVKKKPISIGKKDGRIIIGGYYEKKRHDNSGEGSMGTI